MYATTANLLYKTPEPMTEGVCGRHLFYPDSTGKRQAEGGLRMQGLFKDSQADLPLVSVITPVLNRARILEQAMLSVLTQTYTNIEYILVDGGSWDTTVDTILKYNDAVDYFISEPDSSLYEAINKGLSLARGEFILVLNSDDWYAPNAVARLLETHMERNVDLVSALSWKVDGEGAVQGVMSLFDYDEFVMLLMPLRHELMFMPRKLYNSVGYYDPSYKIASDWKLAQRLFQLKISFYELNECLLYFRVNGLSSNITNCHVERSRLLRENFPFLDDADNEALSTITFVDSAKLIPLFKKYQEYPLFIAALRAYLKITAYEVY